MVSEEAVLSYCDETGYLTKEKRQAYLESIGVIKIYKDEKDFGIYKSHTLKGEDGRTSWAKINDQIEWILKRNSDKVKGRMGVDLVKAESAVNKIDEININEINTSDLLKNF